VKIPGMTKFENSVGKLVDDDEYEDDDDDDDNNYDDDDDDDDAVIYPAKFQNFWKICIATTHIGVRGGVVD
jgi:hypothetical protein